MTTLLASPAPSVALGVLLVAGLLAAWIVRKNQSSRRAALWQGVFFGLLALVGAATIIAVGLGPSYWAISGSALSMMVLTATYDFRRSPRATA